MIIRYHDLGNGLEAVCVYGEYFTVDTIENGVECYTEEDLALFWQNEQPEKWDFFPEIAETLRNKKTLIEVVSKSLPMLSIWMNRPEWENAEVERHDPAWCGYVHRPGYLDRFDTIGGFSSEEELLEELHRLYIDME